MLVMVRRESVMQALNDNSAVCESFFHVYYVVMTSDE